MVDVIKGISLVMEETPEVVKMTKTVFIENTAVVGSISEPLRAHALAQIQETIVPY